MEHDEDKAKLQAKIFEEELMRQLPDDLAIEQVHLSQLMKKRINDGKDPIGDEDIKNRWLSLQFNAAYARASHIAMEKAYGTDFYGVSNEEEPDEPGPFGHQ